MCGALFIVINVTVQNHAGHNISGSHLCSAHCLQGWNVIATTRGALKLIKRQPRGMWPSRTHIPLATYLGH